MAVLVDTGGLVALADARDRYHAAVLEFALAATEPFVVPVTVLPEADYIISDRLGGRAALATLKSIEAGEFQLELLARQDLSRTIEILEDYGDSDIGFVDASIVAVAERMRIVRILTLDRRHFRMLRPRHCAAFELVP